MRSATGKQFELTRTSGRGLSRAILTEVGGGLRFLSVGDVQPGRDFPRISYAAAGRRQRPGAVAEPGRRRGLAVERGAPAVGSERAGQAQRNPRIAAAHRLRRSRAHRCRHQPDGDRVPAARLSVPVGHHGELRAGGRRDHRQPRDHQRVGTAAPVAIGAHPYFGSATCRRASSPSRSPRQPISRSTHGSTRCTRRPWRGPSTTSAAVGWWTTCASTTGSAGWCSTAPVMAQSRGTRCAHRMAGCSTLWQDAHSVIVQVFTTRTFPSRELAIAIEPMTAPANAFNSGGVRWLESGESWTATWGINYGERAESDATTNHGDIRRWRQYLADERAEAAVYRDLAERRTGEEREILLALAEAEGRHEAHWLEPAGRPGRHRRAVADLRTRVLGFLARRFGSVFVLALAQRAEARSPYERGHGRDRGDGRRRAHPRGGRARARRARPQQALRHVPRRGVRRERRPGEQPRAGARRSAPTGVAATSSCRTGTRRAARRRAVDGRAASTSRCGPSANCSRHPLPSPDAERRAAHLDVDANELALVYRARGMSAAEAEDARPRVLRNTPTSIAADECRQHRPARGDRHRARRRALQLLLLRLRRADPRAAVPFGLRAVVAVLVAGFARRAGAARAPARSSACSPAARRCGGRCGSSPSATAPRR